MNHTRKTCTTDGSACIADGMRHAQLVGTLNVPNVCGRARAAISARRAGRTEWDAPSTPRCGEADATKGEEKRGGKRP